MEVTRLGEIRIADDVVAIIAGVAATEIEGIVMAGGLYEGLAKRVSGKGAARGVFVSMEEDETSIEMRVFVKYGTKIAWACQNLQEKVKEVVEALTGLRVREVNVKVDGIEM